VFKALKLDNQTRLIHDVIYAIENDRYMWLPIWGEPRCGKTTLCLLVGYAVYQDWDKVLGSVVFNLNGLLYKMQHGEPCLFPTVVKPIHMRIPYLIYDDFASQSGKAQTQYSIAWDHFKGSFDVLGTRLACLFASMVSPRSPTQQIMEKYTHEVRVEFGENGKRVYKYDRCHTQQDFYGWRARQKKDWLEVCEFGKVPLDVFKEYDELRLGLVDEVIQSMQDVMVDDSLDRVMKRMEPIDYNLLKLIKASGPIHHHKLTDEFGVKGRQAMVRCKARGLITPIRMTEGYYKYDLTSLGFDLLKACAEKDGISQSSKNIH